MRSSECMFVHIYVHILLSSLYLLLHAHLKEFLFFFLSKHRLYALSFFCLWIPNRWQMCVCVCVSASIWSPGFSVHTDAGVEASVNSCCSVKLNVEHLRCHCIYVKLGPSYHTLAIARFAADCFHTFCSDVHLPVKTPWNVRVLVNGICNSLTHDPSITGRVCLDRRIFHTSHNIVEICCSLSFMSGWM